MIAVGLTRLFATGAVEVVLDTTAAFTSIQHSKNEHSTTATTWCENEILLEEGGTNPQIFPGAAPLDPAVWWMGPYGPRSRS